MFVASVTHSLGLLPITEKVSNMAMHLNAIENPTLKKPVLVGVVIRSGRKIVKSGNLSREQVEKCLVDAFQFDVSKALNAFPTLKEGKRFKYKHRGYNVTLLPLVNHVENY